MPESDFALADLERITGAKARSIQLWADAGVLKARPATERGGSGKHRRFSRDEAIVACIVAPFAARRISIGEVLNVSNAVRRQLKEGGASVRATIDDVIAGKADAYLVLATSGPGSWVCKIFDMPGEDHEGDFSRIGAFVYETLDQQSVRGKATSIAMTVRLNDCLAALR